MFSWPHLKPMTFMSAISAISKTLSEGKDIPAGTSQKDGTRAQADGISKPSQK